MSTDVCILSVGARTPVGRLAAASAAAVRAGIRRTLVHQVMLDSNGQPLRAAFDNAIEAGRLGPARILILARSALEEALSAISDRLNDVRQFDVLLALPETRPGFTDADAAWLGRELTRGFFPHSPSRPAVPAARGHAGALDALRSAVLRLREGRSEVCAVVGADSYFVPETIRWLDENRQIAGDGIRSGFIPGEAAGCVVVATRLAAAHLERPMLALIRGVESALETRVIKGNEEVLGHGLSDAVLRACASLSLPAEAADDVYCDINGERYRTDEWAFTLLRAAHVVRSSAYKMSCTSWGDVGAASGALGCVLATQAWARGYASGRRALVTGSSEGGLRSAALLEQALGRMGGA